MRGWTTKGRLSVPSLMDIDAVLLQTLQTVTVITQNLTFLRNISLHFNEPDESTSDEVTSSLSDNTTPSSSSSENDDVEMVLEPDTPNQHGYNS